MLNLRKFTFHDPALLLCGMRDTGSLMINLAYFSTAQLFITESDFDAVAAPAAIGIPLLYGMYNLRINLWEDDVVSVIAFFACNMCRWVMKYVGFL